MKRILLSFFTFLIFSGSYAQVHVGLKAGLNLANVRNEGQVNNKARIGFYAGGVLQSALADNLFVQPELLYSVKGYRALATASTGEALVSLNYIALPVLLNYQPTEKLSLLAGPEVGFLSSAKSRLEGYTYNVSNSYRKIDLGMDLGLSYKLTNSIGADLRYNYGIKDLMHIVYTDQNGNINGQGKAGANQVLQLGLYYLPAKR